VRKANGRIVNNSNHVYFVASKKYLLTSIIRRHIFPTLMASFSY